MKVIVVLLYIGSLLRAESTQQPKSKFRCDTPDEWFFRNGTQNFYPWAKWPSAILKYELHQNLEEHDISEVNKAFDDIQSKTCVRFQPRSPDESAYVLIEKDDNFCGIANPCRLGVPQSVKFGSGCSNMNVIVHELGHSLCLGHEHWRKDRDEFLHFDGCSDIPWKDVDNDLRGSLFDYVSQMAYECGWCEGGWSRFEGTKGCGSDIQQGLSVLDADKLNDFYDCGGCKAYRWKPIDALTDDDRRFMMQWGQKDNGDPLYICRGHVNGEISVGKYWEPAGTCYVPYNGREYELTTHAQVWTLPWGAQKTGSMEIPPFRIANMTDFFGVKLTVEGIKGGRAADGITSYIAVADIEIDGIRESSIGKVFENQGVAYFPFQGREIENYDFGVIVC